MRRIFAAAWSYVVVAAAIEGALNVTTTDQIKSSAKSIAKQLVALYPSTSPSTWWEGGAIYGGLIDYASKTGDGTFNTLVAKQLAEQAGAYPPYFQPTDVAANITNFGQARWALTAILAGEEDFPSDASLPLPYLNLAEAVFGQIASRWDTQKCGGGLNTTVFASGPSAKDTFSAGEFFQLAARLAIKTKNGTYTVWAGRIFDWASDVGLVNASSGWKVYNSADPTFNCSSVDKTQWSVNAGELLYGTALMYNLTFSQSWVTRTTGLLTYINSTFFQDNVVFEPSCGSASCTPSQRTYRALLVKFMAKAAMSAPYITTAIQDILAKNGQAIASGCAAPNSGDNSTCTIQGLTGIGEQLTGLNSVVSLLIGKGTDSGGGGTATTSSTPSAKGGDGKMSPSLELTGCMFVLLSGLYTM